MHTMRSAFKRWAELHGEYKRMENHTRIPNWFRWYIRNNCEWEYKAHDEFIQQKYNNKKHRRNFKGIYTIIISDSELLKLERPPMIREMN